MHTACEIVEFDGRVCGVLGIGINVNSMEKSLVGLDVPATSLRYERRHPVFIIELLKKLLEIMTNCFKVLLHREFSHTRLEIERRLAFINERIVFTGILKPIWFSVLLKTKSWLQSYSLNVISDFIRKPL